MFGKRLIWQLFPSFLVVTLVALTAATTYFAGTFRDFYIERTEDELRMLAEVATPQIAQVLESGDYERLDALCKHLGDAGDGSVRYTVISPGGKVLGDSDERPAIMGNHSDRQEIVTALRNEYGQSTRRSPTLGINMLYVALPIRKDGQPVAVIRSAVPLTAIDRTLGAIYVNVLWAGAAIASGGAFLSLLISRRISQPIVQMRRIAQLFAQGQLNLRVPEAGSAELDDLAKALNEMATQLHDRILTITRQRNELEAVLASLSEGVLAVDSRGRVVSVNKAAAELLSIRSDRAQGRNVEEVTRNVGLQQFVKETLHSDKPTEDDVSFPDEGGRFFHLHGASLVDPRGERSGAVIVLSDMTRVHRLENLRRDFVANVSHELKTPVTSIQGFAEALEEGAIEDPEQARRYLSIIARHAQRLNAIINDLLSLSRLEEGGQQRALSFETTRLQPVLAAAVELSRIKAAEKDVAINVLCDNRLEAKINAPLLEQAVVNLVDNAVKYSEGGRNVDVAVEERGREIVIEVRDQGCGISSEHLDRIFERFYVVDHGRSRKLGGTGLGLAIVQHIPQVQGGNVTVESTPGQGSIFRMQLPAA
jgi:two-component system phosphate regulon sensor histidine kinase PhoR